MSKPDRLPTASIGAGRDAVSTAASPAAAAPVGARAAGAAAEADPAAATRPEPDATMPAAAAELTTAQRDAVDWIARSDYGRRHEWAAQHVLLPATERHPQFSAAAAFASAVALYESRNPYAPVDPYDSLNSADRAPTAGAVRCALDAFVRHGLQLNTPLRQQCNGAQSVVAEVLAKGVGVGCRTCAAGDHTPLTLSVFWCPAMARALLAGPDTSDAVDDAVGVELVAAALRWTVREDSYDAALALSLARRASRAAVTESGLFEHAVAVCDLIDTPDEYDDHYDDDGDGHDDDDYVAALTCPSVRSVDDVKARCALVRQLLSTEFVTDDGDTRGLVLTRAQWYEKTPRVSLEEWCDDAAGDGNGANGWEVLHAYETTRDALRGVLKRQRVFRDALPAVLLQALRPVPREVCALVSAYVLWPVPSASR